MESELIVVLCGLCALFLLVRCGTAKARIHYCRQCNCLWNKQGFRWHALRAPGDHLKICPNCNRESRRIYRLIKSMFKL